MVVCSQPLQLVITQTYPQPVPRTKEKLRMKTRNESRLGRFAYLLKGGAKPRRSFALMMALVLVGMLSLAGVVSADDVWKGTAPETNLSGTVTGGIDVQYVDTWALKDDVVVDTAWANFTLPVSARADTPAKVAKVYAIVYMGNMTANYRGNVTAKLYKNGVGTPTTIANAQALRLEYWPEVGTNYSSAIATTAYTKNISRVTSDYLMIFDVKSKITPGTNSISISLASWNESLNLQPGGKYDGRIKEVKLVYGWDDNNNPQNTAYWINEGHDPITKFMGTYTGNKTWFRNVGTPATYTAKLWVDYQSNSTSGSTVGYGKYWWNDEASHILSPGCSGTGCYPPVITKGYYAGLLSWNWTESSTNTPGNLNDNVLMYSNTSAYYKIPLAVYAIK